MKIGTKMNKNNNKTVLCVQDSWFKLRLQTVRDRLRTVRTGSNRRVLDGLSPNAPTAGRAVGQDSPLTLCSSRRHMSSLLEVAIRNTLMSNRKSIVQVIRESDSTSYFQTLLLALAAEIEISTILEAEELKLYEEQLIGSYWIND